MAIKLTPRTQLCCFMEAHTGGDCKIFYLATCVARTNETSAAFLLCSDCVHVRVGFDMIVSQYSCTHDHTVHAIHKHNTRSGRTRHENCGCSRMHSLPPEFTYLGDIVDHSRMISPQMSCLCDCLYGQTQRKHMPLSSRCASHEQHMPRPIRRICEGLSPI